MKIITKLDGGYNYVEIKTMGGLYIEIKKDGEKLNKKDGSWRTPHIAEQAKKLEKLRARGYRAEFGVGFDECKKIIDEYLDM